MANRYYVADLSNQPSRWTDIVNRSPPVPGRRELPHDLIHWRVSVDGTQHLLQVETNDAEHAYLSSRAYITYLDTDPGVVHAYITTNSAAWERPIGG
ncbi:MAG: hypothetical protein M3440_07210 [Chloroflexota bacterium]|nr:hypothetical protein [Chloroflexota bacterium]